MVEGEGPGTDRAKRVKETGGACLAQYHTLGPHKVDLSEITQVS